MVNHPLHRLFVPLFYPFTYYSLIWLNNSIADYTEYSTSEKIVGKWIDGKPIYRKCFNVTLPAPKDSGSSAIITNSQLSDLNVDKFTKVDGVFFYNIGGNGSTNMNTFFNDNYHCSLDYWSSDGIRITNKGWGNCPAVVILEYTKTVTK